MILSGYFADRIVYTGKSLGFARKTLIVLMALAFFGNGFASIIWSRLWRRYI